ncbi:insulinase family protein [Alphaproteobacteria bacterium GH1-50]|uniref:Insulinase family protein n=1 Tax=Kangsaoukella pontilimi TaxID=2691042 RepID=A0A7C9MWS6_9RHOB|nr:pitrilysin family protein [Kangsaoukella pontilimi]MXQ08580.1 insulinase family protein [Kangsaoukella pontilimi]
MTRVFLALALTLFAALPARAAVDIQEVTSPGGIEAWLVEEDSIPFLALEIRFLGGTSLDPEGKRGVTNLMTGLIEEGAGDMDARAFAAARDGLAASYDFDAYGDGISISARFLTENRDEAVALLREALVNPRFDEDAIERVRAQVLSVIRSDATDPNEIAGRAFDALAFGDHPYGTTGDGTLESVTALTRDDIVAAHQNALTRDRVYVGASGDITADELGALLDTLLGDLPEAGAPLPGPANVALTGGVTVIPFETPQSVAVFGHVGLPRDDPDFFAAFVTNAIFGGSGRQSRLTEEVREKRGLTYGVGAWLANYDNADLLVGRMASANDRVGEAIDVVRDEWAKIAAEGVTETELEEAKTYLTGAYPLRFEGNAPIARIMVGMQTMDLDPDYITTRNDKVNAVTLEDVRRVAARIYQPENLRFVVVGQPEGVEPVN